jgi:hypothetical protein
VLPSTRAARAVQSAQLAKEVLNGLALLVGSFRHRLIGQLHQQCLLVIIVKLNRKHMPFVVHQAIYVFEF